MPHGLARVARPVPVKPRLSLIRRAAIRRASCPYRHEQVRHIAKLARIAMSDEEIERLAPELNNILGWVEQLGEVTPTASSR